MAAKNVTRPQLIDAAERRGFILEQRKGGSSYREIAAAALNKFGVNGLPRGYDSRYAHDDVLAELKRLREQNSELAGDVRDLELIRLDRMQASLWTSVLGGSETAIDRVLKIMQRRADLLGLDAPKRTDLTSKDEKLDAVQVLVYLPDNKRDNSD